jgi:putative transposase
MRQAYDTDITDESWEILEHTLGLLILVVVTAANVTDYDGARAVLSKLNEKRKEFPRL